MDLEAYRNLGVVFPLVAKLPRSISLLPRLFKFCFSKLENASKESWQAVQGSRYDLPNQSEETLTDINKAHPNTRSQAARAQTQSQQAPNPTQATPSAGNPPIPAYILEGRGAHWDRIYNNVETVVSNLEQDPFLNGLLARHVGDLRAMPGLEDQETFLYLVTRFIDRTNEFTTARQAIIYLARSDWDLEIALTNYEMAEEGMSLAEISGSDSSASESSGEVSSHRSISIMISTDNHRTSDLGARNRQDQQTRRSRASRQRRQKHLEVRHRGQPH